MFLKVQASKQNDDYGFKQNSAAWFFDGAYVLLGQEKLTHNDTHLTNLHAELASISQFM